MQVAVEAIRGSSQPFTTDLLRKVAIGSPAFVKQELLACIKLELEHAAQSAANTAPSGTGTGKAGYSPQLRDTWGPFAQGSPQPGESPLFPGAAGSVESGKQEDDEFSSPEGLVPLSGVDVSVPALASAAAVLPPTAVLSVSDVFAARGKTGIDDLSEKAWLRQFVQTEVAHASLPSVTAAPAGAAAAAALTSTPAAIADSAPPALAGVEAPRVIARVRPLHSWEEQRGIRNIIRGTGAQQQCVEVQDADDSKGGVVRVVLDGCLDDSATQEDTFNVSAVMRRCMALVAAAEVRD